jgi:hypothetical protein
VHWEYVLYLVRPGIIAAEDLSAVKVGVELPYVPGHIGVEWNLKAGCAARSGARQSVRKPKVGKLMTKLDD